MIDLDTVYNISTHALREEGDGTRKETYRSPQISTHALREEGDTRARPSKRRVRSFLPTPSARRATRGFTGGGGISGYFYPRPPRGGRHIAFDWSLKLIQFLPTPSARRATCCHI